MQERKGLCSGQREESLTRGEGVQEEEQEESVCACVQEYVREREHASVRNEEKERE